jgi:hypothetical protein
MKWNSTDTLIKYIDEIHLVLNQRRKYVPNKSTGTLSAKQHNSHWWFLVAVLLRIIPHIYESKYR